MTLIIIASCAVVVTIAALLIVAIRALAEGLGVEDGDGEYLGS